MAQPPNHPQMDAFQYIPCPLDLKSLELDTMLQMWSEQDRVEREGNLSLLSVLTAPQDTIVAWWPWLKDRAADRAVALSLCESESSLAGCF